MKSRSPRSSRMNCGVTLIEVVIVVAIIFVLFLIVAGAADGRMFNRKAEAEVQAKEWAAFAYPSSDAQPRAMCVERDTDWDGYISCTVSHIENGATVNEAIECAVGVLSFNDGCRVPKFNIHGGVQ